MNVPSYIQTWIGQIVELEDWKIEQWDNKRPVMFVCQIVELVDLSVKISGNQINDKEV